MKSVLKKLTLVLLLLWTLALALLHAGVMRKPRPQTDRAEAAWYDAKEMGLHHIVLQGSAFGRGLKFGQFTQSLLAKQEDELNDQLNSWFPYKWMRQLGVLGLIAWYHDIDHYLRPEYVEEMYGVSYFAPKKYDDLADGFTRQVAYHGLHEVGQMMVDQGFDGMGCTVAAIKRGGNWIIGRNFDFEGGRIFDKEKIVKWVFPERGNAFVSVIWAGMVGAVTGVNEKGVYISINAAGSQDFRRVGNPSTLVLLEALQEANNSEEALLIIEKSQMFITDIFVINDRQGHMLVVEKSPQKTAHRVLTENSIIANHLLSPQFAQDPVNQNRKAELTTLARFERGQKLVQAVSPGPDLDQTVAAVLGILRDKGIGPDGRPLHLGNRQAIDALIATHAVIYDGIRHWLYVSQGPALVGPFLGYDLKKSFSEKKPIYIGSLPYDPQVTDSQYSSVKENSIKIHKAQKLIDHQNCVEGLSLLDTVQGEGREQPLFYLALGDAKKCTKANDEARVAWEKALSLTPAYAREEREIKRRLQH